MAKGYATHFDGSQIESIANNVVLANCLICKNSKRCLACLPTFQLTSTCKCNTLLLVYNSQTNSCKCIQKFSYPSIDGSRCISPGVFGCSIGDKLDNSVCVECNKTYILYQNTCICAEGKITKSDGSECVTRQP